MHPMRMKLLHYAGIVVASVATYKCLKRLSSYFRLWRFYRSFPQVESVFYFGSALTIDKSVDRFTASINQSGRFSRYRYYVFWHGMMPLVMLHHPDAVKELCLSNQCIDKNYWPFSELVGDGLVCLNGNKWRKHRKLLTNVFHKEVLDNFMPKFVTHSEELVKKIQDFNGQEFDFYKLIVRSTFDILLETLLGLERESFDDTKKQVYLDGIRRSAKLTGDYAMNEIFFGKTIASWMKSGREFHYLVNKGKKFLNEVLQKRIEALKGDSSSLVEDKPLILLDRLIQLKIVEAELSDEEITNELNNFIFGGFDTTTATLSWAMFLLANHPKVQKKLSAENERIIKENSLLVNNEIRIVESSQLSYFTYLEAVLKESQRLYNAVTGISRVVNRNSHIRLPAAVSLDDDYSDAKTPELPEGSRVVLSISSLHRNKEVWGSDANEFRPERFIDGTSPKDPFAFVPFSAGARNCIGQRFAQFEMKCILINLFHNFNFTTWQNFKDCNPKRGATLDPTNGVLLKTVKV